MKTIIFSQIIMGMIMIISFSACTETRVTDHVDVNGEVNANDQFEQTLHHIFTLAGDRLQASDEAGRDLNNIFRGAYLDVLQEDARPDIFEASLENAVRRQAKRVENPEFDLIMSSADTPEEALQQIEAMLEGEELEETSVMELIALKQTILFLIDNNNQLEPVYIADKNSGNLTLEVYHSWWNRWGRCAAGTIGGAGLGAITGCGVGAVAAVGIGCSAGAVIGGISGGLSGAAGYC